MIVQSSPVLPILLFIIVILLIIILWLILRQQRGSRQSSIPSHGDEQLYYVPDQLVLTGLPERIEAARQQILAEFNIDLRPTVEQAVLGRRGQSQAGETAVTSSTVETFYMVRLSGSDGHVTPEDLADSINRQSNYCDIMADANYLAGRHPGNILGNPDSTEGFPLGAPDSTAAKQAFYGQWALQSYREGVAGIELFDERGERTTSATGENVVVAVFDTSPFAGPEWLFDADLELLPSQLTAVKLNHLPGVPDVRDHGLFVASLIEAVAPRSKIQLIRTLDNSNQGTLASLVQALRDFITERELGATNPEQPLAGTVINLSLGVHSAPDKRWFGEPIPTLYCVLKEAYDKGAVIVAASGNNSAQGLQPAQYPAAYPFVVAVSGSNKQGNRSCFANEAELHAPGGDNDANCLNVVGGCANDDGACVIGAAYHTAVHSHFSYWKGTSFSAPMVSGLAALLVEQGMQPANIQAHLLANATVGNAATAVAVINVRRTMQP